MKTDLQKKFEEQTPTITGLSRLKYLQTFVTWLHLQVERANMDNSIPYQLCPKCSGDGDLSRYNSPALSYGAVVCDVCNGDKIIPQFKPKP